MVQFVPTRELDSQPPLAGEEVGPEPEPVIRGPTPSPEEVATAQLKGGKVPLHPAFVRLPLSLTGRAAQGVTGYDGFIFTDQELNDLAELWIQCGVTLSPVMQASVATITVVAIKVIVYTQWRRAGKPRQKGEREEE